MKNLYLTSVLITLSLLFSNHKVSAQITTSPISFNPICPGSIIPVTFNSPGTWLQSTENVTIELSNASGSFASGTQILSNASYSSASWFFIWYPVSYNQTVSVTIPLGTPAGTKYRIRTYSDYNTTPGVNSSDLTINSTPIPNTPGAFSTGPTSMCQNNSATYTVGTVASAVSYQWSYTGTGVTFSGTGNSVTATFSPTASSGDITVYSVNANGCLSNNAQTRTVAISITPTQPSSFTTSTTTICAPQSGITYTVPSVSGATSYIWSYSGSGATINGTGNSVTVDYSASATAGILSVSATNTCGTSTARTLGITLGTQPSQPSAFTVSSSSICRPQSNVIYTIAPVSGATSYSWSYSGSGATISGGTTNSVSINFSSGATSGNLSVTANSGSCTSNPLTMAISINTGVPNRPGNGISNPGSICAGTSGVAISVPASSGATSYTWTYSGTGATINGNSNNITIDFAFNATSGTLSVWATNACGNSSQNRSRNITILNVPAQPSIIATNNTAPCATSTGTTYSVTNIGGTTYNWSYSGTGASIIGPSNGNTITVTYLAATSGTWSATPNNGGCDGQPRTLPVTLGTTGTWLGVTNSLWGTLTNWSCGIIPTSSTDMIVPSSAPNMPVISGTANVRNLTISSGATLTNSSNGTINIYGNFTNTGGTYKDDGLTAFLGSTAQTVTNVDTLHSVTVNNSTGVTLATPTYVEGYLTLANGTLTSNSKLTVDLNVGAITGSGSGSIAGNITVLKWIWNDGWHYISSPLSGKTFTSWNDDVLIKYGANANLYSYDETVVDTSMEVGWTPVTNAATTIQDMQGYALYFPRWIYKTTIDLTGTYNHAQTYSSGTLTNTVSAKHAADGWHLMGNPYPCVIDWDAPSGWTKTGLDGALYIWDQRNNRYATYVGGIGTNGGTRYIPAMQGFYVKVSTSGGTGTLGMNNNVRTTASNPDVWRVASEEKRIHLTATNGTYNDETYIRFSDIASTSFDIGYDAYKLANSGNTPSISTKIGNDLYAINSLPSNLENTIIPVTLAVGLTGAYNINADVSNFDLYDSIILEDRLLKTFQDLKSNNSYSASLSKGDTTTRFFIHYKKEAKQTVVTNTNDATLNKGINIYAYKQNITINFNDATVSNANIIVFDATGNQIQRIDNANTISGKIDISLPNVNTGVYIVKVQSEISITTQQVYINR